MIEISLGIWIWPCQQLKEDVYASAHQGKPSWGSFHAAFCIISTSKPPICLSKYTICVLLVGVKGDQVLISRLVFFPLVPLQE